MTPDDLLLSANAALENLIPRVHEMGVRFTEVRSGTVRAEVPREGNGNHFGVMYAGVTFTVAEVLGGAFALATFGGTTHYPVVRRMKIDFLAPGRSRLVATATLPDDEVARIRAAAHPGARVPFTLHAEVVDEDGTVVARTRGEYQLRPIAP